jgi:hypothetical protein
MKKAAVGIATFLIIFLITLVIKFPYGDMLSSYCARLNKDTKLNITWQKQVTAFPYIRLTGAKILSDEREVAAFDRLDIKLSLGGVSFEGAKENCKLKGSTSLNDITYSLSSLPIPEFLKPTLGTGIISISGTHNIKQKKGKGKFDAAIDKFPNPLISGSLSINGQMTSEPQKTSLVFTLKGASFDGKGTISITPQPSGSPQVSGVLEIKVGQTSLIFNVQGSLDNVTITKAR